MGMPLRTIGPFALDRPGGQLLVAGQPLTIGSRALSLFCALLDADGRVVGKDDLIEAAWPGREMDEANLAVQISNLRRALGGAAGGHDWIVTVPRQGYKLLVPPVEHRTPGALPKLAVLPFRALGARENERYLSLGLVEDLTTALSRFRAFAVIASGPVQ